jgi:hypothetical protein
VPAANGYNDDIDYIDYRSLYDDLHRAAYKHVYDRGDDINEHDNDDMPGLRPGHPGPEHDHDCPAVDHYHLRTTHDDDGTHYEYVDHRRPNYGPRVLNDDDRRTIHHVYDYDDNYPYNDDIGAKHVHVEHVVHDPLYDNYFVIDIDNDEHPA